MAAVGSDRVLIGARRAQTNTGSAFLFSTNGTLLATLTNPTGATNDFFGITVAAVGSDRVLIGDTSGPDGGAVYLFSLVPTLDIQPTLTNALVVSWPLFAPDFLLQQSTNGYRDRKLEQRHRHDPRTTARTNTSSLTRRQTIGSIG